MSDLYSRILAAISADLPEGQTEAARARMQARAETEAKFVEKCGLRVITLGEPDYPQRLLQAPRRPRMLTICGDADLSASRMLAVVGTRRCTPYGTAVCASLIKELAAGCAPVTIVSGLAYGIDAAAHQAALDSRMPTIAVVANGLATVYPAAHRDLARRIVDAGGAIITEYYHDASPYRGRFLERNAVIAALSQATLVVESDIKGGALSTAHHSRDLGRPVLAVPGRITDTASAGCNRLIATGKAAIATCAADIIAAAGWPPAGADAVQQSLFGSQTQDATGFSGGPSSASARLTLQELLATLSPEGKMIVSALAESAKPLTPDALVLKTGLPIQTILAETASLEFEGHLFHYPGSQFALAH